MNDNDVRVLTERNRKFLEEQGVAWEGGFNALVETVRKDEAKEGRFRTFDETAYLITQGGVDHFRETGFDDVSKEPLLGS